MKSTSKAQKSSKEDPILIANIYFIQKPIFNIEPYFLVYCCSIWTTIIAFSPTKHLKKSNAACFYMPIVLKLLIIVQMSKQHEEGN